MSVRPSVRKLVRDTFEFPLYQRLWLLYMKSWRTRTPIIFQFWVWVGFPEILGSGKVGQKKIRFFFISFLNIQFSENIDKKFGPKLFRPEAYPAQTFSNWAYPATCVSPELLRACYISYLILVAVCLSDTFADPSSANSIRAASVCWLLHLHFELQLWQRRVL